MRSSSGCRAAARSTSTRPKPDSTPTKPLIAAAKAVAAGPAHGLLRIHGVEVAGCGVDRVAADPRRLGFRAQSGSWPALEREQQF
jgi:hypothetical protein